MPTQASMAAALRRSDLGSSGSVTG
jgi:hypothetical protein